MSTKSELKLDETNIEEWKCEYDNKFFEKVPGLMQKMSECLSNEEHLEFSRGLTPEEAMLEEYSCWGG